VGLPCRLSLPLSLSMTILAAIKKDKPEDDDYIRAEQNFDGAFSRSY